MYTLLTHLFIKEKDNLKDPNIRRKYGILSSILGISLNILLFAGKYFAGMLSGSIAITVDAFNNLSDAGSSFITLIGFKAAGMKPDADHPYGHGRIEYISGFAVAIAIILMGFELARSSMEKILSPTPIDTSNLAILILLLSILVKIYMAFYNYRIGKKIDSSAMKATSTDSLCDAIATFFVFLSMIIMKFSHLQIDGYCGILVAIFILYAGYSTARETLSPLLGKAPSAELVEQIETLVLAHPDILGIHDLAVHDYGPGRLMISLHGEVSGKEDIFYLHDVIDQIERELNETLSCESVIHLDPVNVDDEQTAYVKQVLTSFLQMLDERITLHDFHIFTRGGKSRISFDIILPQPFPLTDSEVEQQIRQKIAENFEDYELILTIDKDYV